MLVIGTYIAIQKRYPYIRKDISGYPKSNGYQSSHIRIRYPNYTIRIQNPNKMKLSDQIIGLFGWSDNIHTASVSYLAATSKFIICVLGSEGCARRAQHLYWLGQNVSTSNHWWLALPAPLMIKLVVEVTSSREREERLSGLLSGWKWILEAARWSSS
jgi:hypothetical protein